MTSREDAAHPATIIVCLASLLIPGGCATTAKPIPSASVDRQLASAFPPSAAPHEPRAGAESAAGKPQDAVTRSGVNSGPPTVGLAKVSTADGVTFSGVSSPSAPSPPLVLALSYSQPEAADAAEEIPGQQEGSPSAATSRDSQRDGDPLQIVLNPPLPSAQVVQLPVETCVLTALQSHPRILAGQARVAAAQNRIPQQRALPDPMVDSMFWPIEGNALQTAGGRMQDQIGITQQVPWPEKLRARAAVAAREVQVARAEVDSIEREIAEAVRLAYYELWAAQRTIEIIEDNRELVTQLISVSETRYRVGGSQQDVLNAVLERERLEQQQLEAASERAAAQAELAALMQQPRTLVVVAVDSLPLDNLPSQLDALVAAAEQCNPELRGRAFEIQRDLQRQRLAGLQRYPDLQFGTQYGFMTRDGALSRVADGTDNISFSVGMTLPIWHQKIAGGINEAAFNRVSSSQLFQSERLTIEGRLRRLLAEIDSLDQQRALYAERIIPRAEQSLDITTSEYSVGRTSFYELVEIYRELLLYQLQTVRLDAALATRLAQLERTVGCVDGSAYPCLPGAPINN